MPKLPQAGSFKADYMSIFTFKEGCMLEFVDLYLRIRQAFKEHIVVIQDMPAYTAFVKPHIKSTVVIGQALQA